MIDHRDSDCRHWRELLAVLPPDRLSPSEQSALDAHLRSCEDCTSVREQYHLLRAACRDLSMEELPAGLPPRLLQLWQEETARGDAETTKKRGVRVLWGSRIKAHPVRTLLVGIAAAALVVVLTLVPFLSSDSARLPNGGASTHSSAGILIPPPSSVVFAPSHSYEQALRILTNLGLQPSLGCGIVQTTPGVVPNPVWQPVGQKGAFLRTHRLFVWPTASAPDDWRVRLNTMSGVRLGIPENDICSSVVYGTPLPGTAIPMTSSMQARAYARVSFAGSVNYDAALYNISNLGLALGDFCYEQARYFQHQNPTWHPMSQEKSFLNTHALIVVTTTVTSSLWWQQLSATPGVMAISSPYNANC